MDNHSPCAWYASGKVEILIVITVPEGRKTVIMDLEGDLKIADRHTILEAPEGTEVRIKITAVEIRIAHDHLTDRTL